MADRQNRTMICSVLFLDIVEYSRKPVAEQIKLRDCCKALLAEALQSVAPNDRVILDTGDGAAISFLGDPEDAVFMALTLRDSLTDGAPLAVPGLQMRFGINLGPVKLVKDLNGRPNIIGDGINVAQRIMSFANPGQVLVSRSYYEVVSRLSEESARLFSYEGSRTDKHVREHEVYAVGAGGSLLARPGVMQEGSRFARFGRGAAVFERVAHTTVNFGKNLRGKPRFATGLTIVAILAAAVVVRAHRQAPDVASADAPARTARSAAKTPETAPAPAGPDAASQPTKTAVAAAKDTPVPVTAGAPLKGELVVVNLAVSPWGEIYLDGKKVGVSPPLRNIQVTPGQHRIEIRNTTFPRHVQTINARPGNPIRIRHKFSEE